MWISPDPKRQHFNPYTYGANSPINRVDPNGLEDVYYLLGNTYSAKHKTTLLSDGKFNTAIPVSDQEFRKKGYTTKFGKLSEASLEAALSDPEAKFIYILSHGAGPAMQEHDGKEWVQPADIDVVNTTASVFAAGCYLQDYQQTW